MPHTIASLPLPLLAHLALLASVLAGLAPIGCTRRALDSEVELTSRAVTMAPWAPGVSYAVGEMATFNGVTFRCRQAHTSQVGWEPPKVPALWERPGAAGINPWTNQTSYVVGSGVTFDGLVYRCLQSHTSQPDWTPPVVPSLWKVTGNVFIPPGVSGSLAFVWKSKNLPANIVEGFGLVQRDPFGDPAFTELLDTSQRSVGQVFYRMRVEGGEIFELFLQANKTNATSSPSMSPATYSSDPTMNMGIDPTFPDHVAQPLQTAAEKAAKVWSLRWESFRFGDAGRDGEFDDLTIELRVEVPCDNGERPCPDPNLVVSSHNSTLVDYAGDAPVPLAPPLPDIPGGPLRDPTGGEGNPVPIGTSVTVGGRVDTLRWSFVQESTDFSAATPPELSCEQCAVPSPAVLGGGLWSLQIKRVHRPRAEATVSSFGPGVFSNFDAKLSLRTSGIGNQNTVVLFEPQSDAPPVTFFERSTQDGDASVDGRYHDTATRMYAGLVLLDANGELEPDPLSARAAVVTRQTGERLRFEIINVQGPGATDRQARLTAVEDRNANAATVTYQFAAAATDAQLGGDRRKLWLIQRAADPHGVGATFTYGFSPGTSRWVVQSILLPDETTLQYQYGTDPPNLDRLTRVVYPNGDIGSFSRSWDAATQSWALSFRDVAGADVRTWKTVHVTGSTFRTPDGVVHDQEPNLVRRIVNDDGEQVYQAMEDPNDPSTTFYREAANRITRIEVDATGLPREVARASTLSSDPLSASYTVVQSYRGDVLGMIQQATDGFGNVRRFERDSKTRAITSVTARGGSKTRLSFNSFRQPTATVDRLGRRTNAGYDGRGNPLTITHAAGTPVNATWTYAYNARGQVVRSTDANGGATDYLYNTAGFLTSVNEPPDVAGGARAVRIYEYSPVGRLAAATDASGRRVTFSYDTRGRYQATAYPDETGDLVGYGTGPSAGLVVARADRNGVVEQYQYDATRRSIRTTRAFGRPEQMDILTEYLPGTELAAVETTAGERVEITYDVRLRPVARRAFVNGASFLTSQSAWDGLDRKTVDADPYGRRTFQVHDRNGRRVRTVKELVPAGVPTGSNLATLPRVKAGNPPYLIEDVAYDDMNQVVSTTDARGFVTTKSYDGQGRLVVQVEAAGRPEQARTTTEYDRVGNRTKVVHPRSFTEGQTFQRLYTYTGRNLLLTETEAAATVDAATTRYTYTPTGKPLTVTDPRGGVTTNGYDACCDRLASVTDPAGFTTRFEYDGLGNRIATTDPLGKTSRRTYDGRNRTTSEANPLGQATRFVYDDDLTDGVGLDYRYGDAISDLGFGASANGFALETVNAANEATLEVGDGLKRVVLTINPSGHRRRTLYDTLVGGLLETRFINPLGAITRRQSDASGKIRVQIDADGNPTTASFDGSGNIVSTRNPNGVGKDCQYDAFNRSLACSDTKGDTTRRSYDASGNEVSVTDGKGVVSTCNFDFRNRRKSCTDGVGATTRYAYDGNSNLTRLTDGEGKVTVFGYDGRNLRNLQIFPDSSSPTDRVTVAHDGAQRPVARTDQGGNTMAFAYDDADRLISKTDAQGKVDSFDLDSLGRFTSGTSQRYGTTVTRSYDAGGRLAEEALLSASPPSLFAVAYAYDGNDRLSATTYPDGSVVTRSYDDRDQLTAIVRASQSIAQYSYDAGGRLTTTALGNGRVETRRYREDDTLISVTTTGVGDITYTYDANKRKLTEGGAAVNGPQAFTYDNGGRVKNWSNGADTQSWNLSPVGDWQNTTFNGVTETRAHNAAHEIAAINGAAVTHDVRGNLVKDDLGDTSVFDFENKLAGYSRGGAGSVSYAYDVLGRRVGRVEGSVTTTFVPSRDEVIAEYVAGDLSVNYLLGASVDLPVAYEAGGALRWFSANRQGTIFAITDSTGAVVERYRYSAYGGRTILSPSGAILLASAVGNQIGFTGRYHDNLTGLVDLRFRQYSPRLGRFVSRDDEYGEGMSLYEARFVPNSTDPSGHQALGDLTVSAESGPFERRSIVDVSNLSSNLGFGSGLFRYSTSPGRVLASMSRIPGRTPSGGFRVGQDDPTGGMMLAGLGQVFIRVDCEGKAGQVLATQNRTMVNAQARVNCYYFGTLGLYPAYVDKIWTEFHIIQAQDNHDVAYERESHPPVPGVRISEANTQAIGPCEKSAVYVALIRFEVVSWTHAPLNPFGYDFGSFRQVNCAPEPLPPMMGGGTPMPPAPPPGDVGEPGGGGPPAGYPPGGGGGGTIIVVSIGGDPDGDDGLEQCDEDGFIVPCCFLPNTWTCSEEEEEDEDDDVLVIRGSGS